MTAQGATPGGRASASALLPGVALTAALAFAAWLLHQLAAPRGLSGLILALGLGTALRNTARLPALCRAGVAFSLRRVLRLAVVLLGLTVRPS